MSKILYITANPKSTEGSYSLSVAEAFLEAYKEKNPQDEIIHVDVFNKYIPLIDADVFNAWGKLAQQLPFENLTEAEQKKILGMNANLDEFMSVDKYIFVTPLWNFTVPALMKAYIDNVLVAGKTFKYSPTGEAIGLLGDKKAIHIQARGGFYKEAPMSEVEMGDKYINAILQFVGITDRTSVIAEGMNAIPEKAEEFKAAAIKEAKEAALKF